MAPDLISSDNHSAASGFNNRSAKLVFTLVVLAGALVVLWTVDSAMSYQYRLLEGCWPRTMISDQQRLPSEDFLMDRLRTENLGTLQFFFYSRVHHRILLYFLIVLAVIGWSGSFCLRLLSEERSTSPAVRIPGWLSMFASLMLSGLAGAILFLLLIAGRLLVDPEQARCISERYIYLAALAGLGSGLFVVRFFEYFRSTVQAFWTAIAKQSS